MLIELWLKQFRDEHSDLAARVLDSVLFIGHDQIHQYFRNLLNGLDGWDIDPNKRIGDWCFVPFSGSAGESGDSMVHSFRMATKMSTRKFNSLFIHRSELVARQLGPNDTVVLIDDFSGSGKQACDSWREIFEEMISGGPRVILLLVAATEGGLMRIKKETEMEAVCVTILLEKDNIFSGECVHFTDAEKLIIRSYCKIADRHNPEGFGGCGLAVVLAHRCPNNTIPILHYRNDKWHGLFPRHE